MSPPPLPSVTVRYCPLLSVTVRYSSRRLYDPMLNFSTASALEAAGAMEGALEALSTIGQVLAVAGRYWPLLAVTARYCPLLPVTVRYCPRLHGRWASTRARLSTRLTRA